MEFFGLFYIKASMYERSVSASLSNIEAVRLPNQVISDVHAISANNHNYHELDLI